MAFWRDLTGGCRRFLYVDVDRVTCVLKPAPVTAVQSLSSAIHHSI